jgi:copper resistance protein C
MKGEKIFIMRNKASRVYIALLASCLSLGLVLFVAVGTVSAHAKVIDSTPKANSTITKEPATIQVTTAENMTIDPKQTNLFVYGPNGELISLGNATIDINNPIHMSVKIKTGAGNGIYIVRWITKSADDGDPAEGAFAFTVNPTTVQMPASNQSTTTNTTTTSNSSSSPVVPAIVVGVIALLIGLGAGIGIGRARPAAARVDSSAETTPDGRETTPRT